MIRILMLGDSFTEGRGLPLEATVAKRAEAMLNGDRCPRVYQVLDPSHARGANLFAAGIGAGLQQHQLVTCPSPAL